MFTIKKYKIYSIIFFILLGVSATGAYLSYSFWAVEGRDVREINPPSISVYAYEEYEPIEQIRLSTGATVVYLHHDKSTGQTSESTSYAPSFMINRTKNELIDTFNHWNVVSFEPNQIILERTIETLPIAAYTISLVGDFITIFRGQKSNNDILEVTTITVGHLPDTQIERLERGVPVADRNELVRRLEDFGR